MISDWGSWLNISKLCQVGGNYCVFFFWFKSSLLVSKVNFNFVYTFRVYTSCVHVHIHIIKIVTNILMDFKTLMSSWGRNQNFKNYVR